ncbi:hypothetical protein HMPREF1415_00825 [Helicobacter pylori GAM254Ai]|nr:hypothetical protein HMPREF1415_00825 [Helicobacter pylori GAM254Ai]
MGIFGSVILKLLFLRMGFFALLFIGLGHQYTMILNKCKVKTMK